MAERLLPQLDTSGLQVVLSTDNLDRNLLHQLSYTARGTLAPLCACIGGIIAQETLKALTGKYTPLNQWVCIFVCITRRYRHSLLYSYFWMLMSY